MILLVDAGNTRIKWAFLEHGELRPGGAWPTRDVAGLCAAWAGAGQSLGAHSGKALPTPALPASGEGGETPGASLCRTHPSPASGGGREGEKPAPPRPDDSAPGRPPLPGPLSGGLALGACVAGEAVRAALAACLGELGLCVHWVAPQKSTHGLVNRYQPPESLGVDRYCALIGAARRIRRDCVVVCVGTAMTADVLTAEGEFLGGCIVPGPELMRAALASGTAGVGVAAGDWQEFPRGTGAAVATGVALALAGVVQGMAARLAEFRGPDPALDRPVVVLTGGGRSWLAGRLQPAVIETDELVLEGLAWIARDLACAA